MRSAVALTGCEDRCGQPHAFHDMCKRRRLCGNAAVHGFTDMGPPASGVLSYAAALQTPGSGVLSKRYAATMQSAIASPRSQERAR